LYATTAEEFGTWSSHFAYRIMGFRRNHTTPHDVAFPSVHQCHRHKMRRRCRLIHISFLRLPVLRLASLDIAYAGHKHDRFSKSDHIYREALRHVALVLPGTFEEGIAET